MASHRSQPVKLWTETEIEVELREIGHIAGSKPQPLQQEKAAQLIVNNPSFGRILVLFQFNNGQSYEGSGLTIGEALTKARHAAENFLTTG
jgi:hypothetical protein